MKAADEENVRSTQFNFNTILIATVLGVCAWVGRTVQQTQVEIAVMSEKTAVHDRDIVDLRIRLASVEMQVAKLSKEIK